MLMRSFFITTCQTALITVAFAALPAHAGNDTLLGTGIGAAVGGLFGSQFGHGAGQVAATGIGVVTGGLIGNNIGQTMDEESFHAPVSGGGDYAIYNSPPAVIVYNNYTPNYVAPPAPPPTYIDQDSGAYCRPFSQEIRINGHYQESYGTACLQPDGTWRIVP